jgi:hypothetical protein
MGPVVCEVLRSDGAGSIGGRQSPTKSTWEVEREIGFGVKNRRPLPQFLTGDRIHFTADGSRCGHEGYDPTGQDVLSSLLGEC